MLTPLIWSAFLETGLYTSRTQHPMNYSITISNVLATRMNRALVPAVLGVVIAIAITTTMDATGYAQFSALPLFPLAGLF